MNRGTYNQLVHLGKGPELFGFNVVAPGQSGDPRSLHFADQLELYASWRYKPMLLDNDLHNHFESSVTLHADEEPGCTPVGWPMFVGRDFAVEVDLRRPRVPPDWSVRPTHTPVHILNDFAPTRSRGHALLTRSLVPDIEP